MDNKADVKAIMARFNTGNSPSEGVPTGRPPGPQHAALSTAVSKKSTLELSLSGNSTPKPNFLKGTISTQSAPEALEFPRLKPITGLDGKSALQRQQPSWQKSTEASGESDQKAPGPKPPLQKPPLTAKLSDGKPAASPAKPSWVKESPKSEDSVSGVFNKPPLKPVSSVAAMRSHIEDGMASETVIKSTTGSSMKPAFLAAQAAFNKENNGEVNKAPSSQTPADSKPPPAKKLSINRKPQLSPAWQKENSDPSVPKKNPLPNIFTLGSAPPKPNRPPKLNLDRFKKMAEPEGSPLKKVARPQVLVSSANNSITPPPTSQPLAPSLPPRPPGGINQPEQEEHYDDVGEISKPPPLPTGAHPSQRQEDNDSDGDMYEDLEERWASTEVKEQDKDKKTEKEEKKRLEQEKKEQKEREKKEQEMRKKFKLTGPIRVIHKAKAKVDCKGGKTELSVKQGDSIDIIRITDNPEGRWLGRSQDGLCGYIKTESVDIDFDKLKRQGGTLGKQAEEDPELYDDVGVQDDTSSGGKGGVVLPPPPGDEGDIYDDLEDPDLNVSNTAESGLSPKAWGLLNMLKGFDNWRKSPTPNSEVPPPPQFTPDTSTASGEEIYDDVDSPKPTVLHTSSLSLHVKPKVKVEEKDPKKQKKFEKEEKNFRKNFKFDGEIQALYQVTVIATITNKKWANKDLPLKPGEVLDVISKPVDNKMVCRNEEGKFGYVLTSNIVAEENDVYDDVGDDCIYDND